MKASELDGSVQVATPFRSLSRTRDYNTIPSARAQDFTQDKRNKMSSVAAVARSSLFA